MNIGDLYSQHDFWLSIGQPLENWLVGLGVPNWLVALIYVAVGGAAILGAITVFVIIAIWAERRFIARLQDRLGPNRVGKFGLLQSVADAVKLLGKEIIRPRQADPFLHFLAPALILGASLMVWAVIPWGPGLHVTDLNVAVLYLLAFGAIPALGVTIAGWGSTNKYSLFGGMRAVVQYVSYEVPGAVVLIVPVLLARSMSLQDIVQAQSGPLWNWFVFQPVFFVGPIPIPIPIIGLIAFVYYLIAGLAETNRTPFDHVEADSELTGGFTTEYSGMQFALFFLAEYANSIAVGLLASTLFLGGYHTGLGDAVDNAIWILLPGVLITKAAIIFLIFVWVRGTLPRFRYDQL
ncbi:MAG: NADH-quinone oxidoreductase subunit H, partial [Chloroflexi bacterium]|nr:NADH-quinone oxidoreductase subunit H [Chloroflexota bacterium]